MTLMISAVEPPPKSNVPQPFQWRVLSGAEGWTDDPDQIAGLSDKPIIEGILREREVGSVIGPAKTAKTWFSLAMGLAVAKGEAFLGKETHQRKTLYLDYELKEGTFRKRMSFLSDTKPVDFFFQCLRGAQRLPRIDEIADLVVVEGFGLVIVDSLYRTGWLTEENNNDSTSRELAALQAFTARTGCSIVCVDHTAKGGGSDRSAVDAARGASAKGGFYDALLVLRPTDKGPDPAGTYAILDPVLRDWPRFGDLPLISFSWSQLSATVDIAGTVERSEVDANATRVLAVIGAAENGASRSFIAAESNLPETTVRRILDGLVRHGRAIEYPDPKHAQRKLYRLPDMADEPFINELTRFESGKPYPEPEKQPEVARSLAG